MSVHNSTGCSTIGQLRLLLLVLWWGCIPLQKTKREQEKRHTNTDISSFHQALPCRSGTGYKAISTGAVLIKFQTITDVVRADLRYPKGCSENRNLMYWILAFWGQQWWAIFTSTLASGVQLLPSIQVLQVSHFSTCHRNLATWSWAVKHKVNIQYIKN